MAKPKLILLILISFSWLHLLKAQKRGYEPGYIITLEGDTLLGQLKDRSPEPFVEIYRRIRFIPEDRSRREKYSPRELLGYRIGGRAYESVALREETAFFKFRYYRDPGSPKRFLRLIRRDGPLTYYLQEFVHDDNNFVDDFPLLHMEGSLEMVRVTQGILGLKRKRLMEYFSDCEPLVQALYTKELKEVDEVYDFYLNQCLNSSENRSYPDTIE